MPKLKKGSSRFGSPERIEAMKKQDPTIRLSKEKCAAIPCGKSGFKVKSEPRDLSLPLCHEHLVMKLGEWEAEDRAEEQRLKQQKKSDKEESKKGLVSRIRG